MTDERNEITEDYLFREMLELNKALTVGLLAELAWLRDRITDAEARDEVDHEMQHVANLTQHLNRLCNSPFMDRSKGDE